LQVQRIAAFSEGDFGGNPAGVAVCGSPPDDATMLNTAAEVGYSETVYATPNDVGWRVRYFSPEREVPFCGHATIALGAALTARLGSGTFRLITNETSIEVTGMDESGGRISAAFQSPPTESAPIEPELLSATLHLFGYKHDELDKRIAPTRARAGAEHLLIPLASRHSLSNMNYDLDSGRDLMDQAGLLTIAFVFAESGTLFHARNAFASGGVYEDPATGSAAAALAGYLRDCSWVQGGELQIVQGEDMGMRSRILAKCSTIPGSSIRVSGSTRLIP
jgi:PhzF family phenazine biosynthesis protein